MDEGMPFKPIVTVLQCFISPSMHSAHVQSSLGSDLQFGMIHFLFSTCCCQRLSFLKVKYF